MTLPRSGIREIFDLALQLPDVIHLEVGEPDFATPPHVVRAAADAAAQGYTKYVANAGMADLRSALVDHLRVAKHMDVEIDQVVVANGAVQGLFSTLLAMLEPGDEVLIPAPAWPNYAMMIRALHATPVEYHLTPASSFEPRADELAGLMTAKSKAIIVNSPSNPLGSIITKGPMTDLLAVAKEHGLWVIADECYESIVFDDGYVGVADLDDDGQVVSVFSFSKTYAMTGWRVGYVVGPAAVTQVVAKLQEPIISCVNTLAQRAALAALTGPQDIVGEMRAAYRSRRDQVLDVFERGGVAALRPAGGFYVWVDVSSAGMPSLDFAKRLLVDERVAVAPGTAFGASGEGAVRLSLATATDQLLEGARRIASFLADHGM